MFLVGLLLGVAPPLLDAGEAMSSAITPSEQAISDAAWKWVSLSRTSWLTCVGTAIRAFAPQPETADAVVTGAIGLCEHRAEEWSYAVAEMNRNLVADPYVDARKFVAGETAAMRASLTGDVMVARALQSK